MFIDFLTTPLGTLEIRASQRGITHVLFSDDDANGVSTNAITSKCKKQLAEYFESERTDFDLPFDQQGTDFQMSVWNALVSIPFGKVASYRDIANAIHNPKAVRAVGAANGKNPISIIVPCHRIIGSDGTLTGYAGGLARKKWLLDHECVEFKVS